MNDHADGATVDRDGRDCSTTARRRDIDRSAVGVHVARGTFDRVADVQCRVAQGQRKGVAHGRRRCVSELDDQVRDGRPTPGFSEQSHKEPDRDTAERDLIRRQGGIDERSVGPGKTHHGDPDHPEAKRRRSRDGPRPRPTGGSECREGAPDGCGDDRCSQRRLDHEIDELIADERRSDRHGVPGDHHYALDVRCDATAWEGQHGLERRTPVQGDTVRGEPGDWLHRDQGEVGREPGDARCR